MVEKLRHPRRGQEVGALATRQHGVVARWQLLRLGVPGRTIEGWVDWGWLMPLHREVFAVGHQRIGRRGKWWCGVLAYGGESVLSHRTGASLWGLAAQRRGPVEVTAPGGRQGPERRDGFWIHRCKLTPEDCTERDKIPVTTVARTLFDFAEVESFRRLEQAWEEADLLKLLRLRDVELVCERGYGRRALKPIRRLLTAMKAPSEGRSPLEERFHAFAMSTAFPNPPATSTSLAARSTPSGPRRSSSPSSTAGNTTATAPPSSATAPATPSSSSPATAPSASPTAAWTGKLHS